MRYQRKANEKRPYAAWDEFSDWQRMRVLPPDIWKVIKTKIDEKMLILSDLDNEFSVARLAREFSSKVQGGAISCESLDALI